MQKSQTNNSVNWTYLSYSIIRKWLELIGLYELDREKGYRTDGMFTVDLTVELIADEALVVLAVALQHFEEQVL